jgi:hypothetical protein
VQLDRKSPAIAYFAYTKTWAPPAPFSQTTCLLLKIKNASPVFFQHKKNVIVPTPTINCIFVNRNQFLLMQPAGGSRTQLKNKIGMSKPVFRSQTQGIISYE